MDLLSLGGGVQSTTLLLLSLHGELPRLDGVIFADTGWEPAEVYAHLQVLEEQCRTAGLPFHRVSAGNLRTDALSPDRRFASMPLHVLNTDGRPGMIRRQCTSEYKIAPIHRKIRELLGGNTRGKQVRQWVGISLDEVGRMRPSHVRYVKLIYPLIDRGMRRHDCLRWLQAHGFPAPPKSACVGCPFHGNAYWRRLKEGSPGEWADAVAFDEAIRNGNVRLGKEGLRGKAFLHRSLKPLSEVDLSTAADHGQLDLFANDCSGACGV